MPYMRRPPILSSFSKTVTLWPAQLSCWAAARPAGPDPTTATCLPVLLRRRGFGGYPALVEGPVDDRELYLLDRHGLVVDREHARRLARCGAQHPRELRKVVGRVQPV